MSIFDNLDPGQIADMLNRQFGEGTAQNMMGAQQPQQQQPPEMPPPPTVNGEGDVSGFANYGMTPPGLPEPMSQIRGIMGMMGNPNQNRRQVPPPQIQQGGLMAYLQSLGV